jgi:hypothetical protein
MESTVATIARMATKVTVAATGDDQNQTQRPHGHPLHAAAAASRRRSSLHLLMIPVEKNVLQTTEKFGCINSWQTKILNLNFIHSKPIGWILFFLLVIDIIIIFIKFIFRRIY